jgi:hypothetical protein
MNTAEKEGARTLRPIRPARVHIHHSTQHTLRSNRRRNTVQHTTEVTEKIGGQPITKAETSPEKPLFLSVFAGCKQFLLRNYVERLLEG